MLKQEKEDAYVFVNDWNEKDGELVLDCVFDTNGKFADNFSVSENFKDNCLSISFKNHRDFESIKIEDNRTEKNNNSCKVILKHPYDIYKKMYEDTEYNINPLFDFKHNNDNYHVLRIEEGNQFGIIFSEDDYYNKFKKSLRAFIMKYNLEPSK